MNRVREERVRGRDRETGRGRHREREKERERDIGREIGQSKWFRETVRVESSLRIQ